MTSVRATRWCLPWMYFRVSSSFCDAESAGGVPTVVDFVAVKAPKNHKDQHGSARKR
jgi:hypothetical protein